MNRNLLLAIALSVATGLGGYALSNYAGAQGASSAQSEQDIASPAAGPRMGDLGARGTGGWRSRRWLASREMPQRWRIRTLRGWGLFSPQADKNLSAADVQTIAEAILLRHGNHSWKVANVAQNQDDTVSFAFATQGGDVIARFAIDVHTGRIRRIG
jgi:hypothetical protein